MLHSETLLMGVVFGVVLSALVAGWLWVEMTPGDDHPLSDEEIRARVGEVY